MMKKKLLNSVLAMGGTAAYLYAQNTWIQKTAYDISLDRLAPENEGLKIAQLADLHMPNTKINSEKLIAMLKEEAPDVIFMTGDQVDAANAFDFNASLSFFQKLKAIAPVYAVNGNHDINSPNRKLLGDLYRQAGVTFLENEAYSVLLAGRKPLVIMGVAEPKNVLEKTMRNGLRKLKVRTDWEGQTQLLLAHHPEHFESYHDEAFKSPDVTFSGHAHGGQIRIPKVGGLFAPGQGRLPEHTSGVYALATDQSKKLVISRGLGPSQFPFRINNRPELVIVKLHVKAH